MSGSRVNVHQVQVVQTVSFIQAGLVDGIDPDIAGPIERLRVAALHRSPPAPGASTAGWTHSVVDRRSSAVGCRDGRFEVLARCSNRWLARAQSWRLAGPDKVPWIRSTSARSPISVRVCVNGKRKLHTFGN